MNRELWQTPSTPLAAPALSLEQRSAFTRMRNFGRHLDQEIHHTHFMGVAIEEVAGHPATWWWSTAAKSRSRCSRFTNGKRPQHQSARLAVVR